MTPHPVTLKIDANCYRHLTEGVNYDLSEKVPRKEQVHGAMVVLEISMSRSLYIRWMGNPVTRRQNILNSGVA